MNRQIAACIAAILLLGGGCPCFSAQPDDDYKDLATQWRVERDRLVLWMVNTYGRTGDAEACKQAFFRFVTLELRLVGEPDVLLYTPRFTDPRNYRRCLVELPRLVRAARTGLPSGDCGAKNDKTFCGDGVSWEEKGIGGSTIDEIAAFNRTIRKNHEPAE